MKNCVLKGNKNIIKIANDLGVSEDFVRTIAMENPSLSDKGLFFETAKTINRIALNTRVNSNNESISSDSFVSHVRNRIESDAVFNYNNTESAVEVSVLNGEPLITIDSNLSRATVDSLIADTSAQELLRQMLPELGVLSDLFTSDNQLKSFLMRYASLVVENGLPNIFAVEGVLSELTSPEAQVKVLSEAYKQSIQDVSDYPLSSAMILSENAKEREYGNNIRNYHNIVRSFLGNSAQLMQRFLRNNEALNKVLSFLGVDMTVRKTSVGVFFTPEKSNTQLSLEDKYIALETLFQSYLSESESQDDTALPKFTEFGEEVDMRRLTDLINRYIADKFAHQHIPLIRRVPFESLPVGMVNNHTAMKAVLDLLERQYGFDMTELQDAIEDSYVSNFDDFLTDVFTHIQSLNNTNPREALPFQINLANTRLKKLVGEAKLQDTQSILDSLKKTAPQGDSLESLISAVSPDMYVNHIFPGILDTLRTKVKHGKSTFNSQFISLLENIISNNNFIKYATIEVSDSLPEGKYGEYYEEDNKIVLSSKIPNIPELGINFENVLIHEVLHAATINAPTALKKKLSSFLDIVNAQIRTNLENEITNSKGYKRSKDKKAYLEGKINEFYTDINYQSLTKPMEFLADFFRNKELANLLNDLDATGTVVVRKKGIFETIVDFIKDIFRFKRPNKETTALDEASQLVNDAIVLGSQTARTKISDYKRARDRVVRVKKLNRANMLHKAGKASENIKHLPKILKSLEETRPDIASKLLDRELNTYKGISPMIQYLYSLYESGVIDTSDLTTINDFGVFSKDFLKRALEYMQKDNFKGYEAFAPKNLKSNLTIKETILLREAGRITAKPIAKYNNHFYSIVVKRNGNYDLNNLQAREKIEVSFKDGVVRRADNGQILEDVYSPLFFAEKPPTKDLQMIQAYDNDMTVVNTKVRALVREVSYIFDELLEIKQRTVPTMTREKMINSLTFDQLRELIYNKLQYYSDNSDDSNREAVGLFSEHIDALISRSLSHLQFTEGITFKSRYLKNKNKKQKESDVELPDDKTAEEDSEGDDLLEAGETQSIQYNIKADTKKIFDKTSVKLKKVLYNLVDINSAPEEVTGSFATIDVNLVKDVLLEALDSIFDPNDVMVALEYYSEAYPFLLDLMDQIEDDPTLLTQIYNTFTLTRVDALSVRPTMKHPFQKVNHVFLKTNKITSWAANMSEGVRLDPDYYVTSGAGVQNKAQLSERIKKVVKLAAEVRKDLKTLPRLTEQERENAYPGIVERLMHIIHSVGVESSRDRLFVHLKGTLHESRDPMKKALKLVNIISSSLSVVEKNVNKNKKVLYTSQEISHSLSKMFSRVYTELQSIDFQRGESYVNEGGKGYYLNRQPSYISKILDGFKTNKPWLNTQEKIERRREFLNKHFFRYPGTYARINPIKANNREIRFFSDFIERMANDPDFANNNTYVSFKNINIAGTRTEFKNLSENMQLAVLMSGFFSNEKVKVSEYKDALMDSSEAYFPFNNFSDSPELGFIKGIRYTGEDYKDRINTNLTNLAISELKRISVVKKAKEEGVMPDVANLAERGDTFVKFPFLEEIKDELLGLLDTAPAEIHGRIKETFETYLEGLANEFTDSILYETEEDGVVFRVPEVEMIVSHGKKLSGQEYKDRLTEYYYNQYNAYAEFTHLLGIDHAMYKNAVEFQKRFKQVYSHGVPLNTNAKIPEVTVNMDTGNIVSTGEFVKTGKSKRVTVVLSDYRVFSSVSNEMIRSITEAFPNNIEQRVRILSSLGVYNHGEMVIGGDTYARSVTLGTFIKNDTQITGEEYFKVMGENPGAEKKYYIDAEDPGNMYETQRMNITDGQTFLSLSEMRSMMSMYDNWTIENEIEFQKYQVYKENDIPTEGIFSKFYNSIKSFYFGTSELSINNEVLKNNVQFKHSEALLAPNDIMGSSELLQNISEFLENPPTVMIDGVEYQIGAISFDSTQKTGSHNVVNINDLNPADVGQTLRNAVADGKYTVTDYSNYIIQQPTPNHITNNTKQLVGTQSRRILYADIPANATFEIAGKVYNKEEYTDIVNNIVNKGIRKAFDKLQKRFENNNALSELLIDTVLSSNLYHKDLVNAFKLDAQGNFKLPLFNPANSVMVERMITSIIRTNVTKQYIRGGKVVNTSNVGYSENLKILFETKNDKLIPTFFEVYSPFPGTEQEWRDLHDSDGNFLWENVDEKFREMVFYRIPTESKYSIVPVRVKEFLPPSSGVSFILPNEISTLTGLDFDIDAMYGFVNDYTFSKGKLSVIPSSNPDDFLSDDLRLKRIATEGPPQQGQEAQKAEIERRRQEELDNSVLSDGEIALLKQGASENEIANYQSDNYMHRDGKGAIKEFNEINAKYDAEIDALEAQITPQPSSSVSPTVSRSTNTSDNNLLIDLFLSNLNNESSVQERFKLGGFDGVMETSYEIALLRQGYTREQLEEMNRMPNPLRHKRNLVESASRDMNAIENDLFFRNQSIVGMNNVPIFVNNRSFKNFLSSLKGAHIQLNRSKGHVAIQTDLVRLLVKGAEQGQIPLIRTEYVDDDGNIRRPKDDTSEDAAAAVDIAKSPVHPNIGLNPYNTQAYTALRFIGADSRKINSIMANPLISWEIPYRFKLLRKPGSVFDTVKAFVSIYDYKLGYDLLNPELDATSLKTALQAAAKRAGIESAQVENMSMELLEESMNYLALSINTIANTLSEFSGINKTDAVNNGPSLSIENMVKTNLEFDRVTRDSNKALKVVTTEDFDNNFVVNFHDYTFNRTLEALNKNFNVNVIEKVYTILNMFRENKEVIQAIYLSYAYDNVKMYDGSAVNNLVLDAFPNYFIENLRSDPKYNDSWLLNNLEHDKEAFFINAYQKPDKDKIIGDWMKMFNDPNHREDAYNLAVYSYFRRSSTKGLNNLYYMIPSDIQTELNLFTDINNNPELLDEYILSESMAKISDNTKYTDRLKDMAGYFPASEIMEGDLVERVLEIIGKQITDGTYISSFYKINKEIYYYDAANHDLTLLSDLMDYLPATLEEKTNITHDDINKEEREVVEENETAMESPSDTNAIDEMTYDTEVFSSKYYKDIKQIETLTELLDSMEASIIDLQQSEDPLQQDVYNAGVSYLEIVSENYDEFPEFEGMTSEEIEREINDTRSCLL